jgi:hypothetical protein
MAKAKTRRLIQVTLTDPEQVRMLEELRVRFRCNFQAVFRMALDRFAEAELESPPRRSAA